MSRATPAIIENFRMVELEEVASTILSLELNHAATDVDWATASNVIPKAGAEHTSTRCQTQCLNCQQTPS